ncbi:MAG: hypothetical protein ACJ75Q_00590 [Gaiellaceae bacterium]
MTTLLNWGHRQDLTRQQAAILWRVLNLYRAHVNDNALLEELALELRAMACQVDRPMGGIRVGPERLRGGDGVVS